MIVNCAVTIAVYFASVFIFYFIANIVCTIADLDTDLLVMCSFGWPITIVVAVFILLFCFLENASDYVADKICDAMYERKRRREEKEDNELSK